VPPIRKIFGDTAGAERLRAPSLQRRAGDPPTVWRSGVSRTAGPARLTCGKKSVSGARITSRVCRVHPPCYPVFQKNSYAGPSSDHSVVISFRPRFFMQEFLAMDAKPLHPSPQRHGWSSECQLTDS